MIQRFKFDNRNWKLDKNCLKPVNTISTFFNSKCWSVMCFFSISWTIGLHVFFTYAVVTEELHNYYTRAQQKRGYPTLQCAEVSVHKQAPPPPNYFTGVIPHYTAHAHGCHDIFCLAIAVILAKSEVFQDAHEVKQLVEYKKTIHDTNVSVLLS